MKRILIITVLLTLNASTSFAHLKTGTGIFAGAAIPIGKLSDRQTIGYEIGGTYRIALPNKYIMPVLGISYLFLPGKEEVTKSGYIIATTNYSDFYLYKMSAGTFIGREKGLYALPALCYSRYEDTGYPGIQLHTGYLLSLQNMVDRLNIGAKFELLRGESKSLYIFSMGLGIFFQ